MPANKQLQTLSYYPIDGYVYSYLCHHFSLCRNMVLCYTIELLFIEKHNYQKTEEKQMAKISQDAYDNIEIYLGTDKANEVAEKVRKGELSPEEAEAWGKKLKESFENRSNKTIDPENWSAFEDGWRPE